jgi:hypothetical protein
MKLLTLLLSRILNLIDALFDAAGAILRVLIRGQFRAGPGRYRGARFAQLSKDEVFAQEVALNAADEDQARRVIALDPERRLPLSPEAALFDIAGPLPEQDQIRGRPERSFLLGVVRKEALVRVRANLPKHRATTLEGFAYAPPDHAGVVFFFRDAPADRRRRFRRGVLAVAISAFCFSAWEAHGAWREALDRTMLAADADRVQIERRVRLAERGEADAQAALAALATQPAPTMAEAAAQLSALAYRQPAQSEVHQLSLTPQGLSLQGRSFAPSETELELRRAFEGAIVIFSPAAGDAPAGYEARVSWAGRQESAP